MPTLDEHPDFPELLRLAGEGLELVSHIIEKDYWVTRILRAIAEEPSLRGRVLFKGGTSLSKGWGLIERFSEDVDILLVESEHGEHGSRGKRRDQLRHVRGIVATQTPFPEYGDRDSYIRNHQVMKVRYPIPTQLDNAPSSALTEGVLLEVGFRGGRYPSETVELESLVGRHIRQEADGIPDELADCRADLTPFAMDLLDPVRTFAEKLLAIHCKYESGEIEERVRDYYDVVCLSKYYPSVQEEVGTPRFHDILVRAAVTSQRHFGAEVDPDDLPRVLKESEAYQPPPERRERLARAYEAEADLYYEGQPSFDHLMDVAGRIRNEI